jgi:hypothetical protein
MLSRGSDTSAGYDGSIPLERKRISHSGSGVLSRNTLKTETRFEMPGFTTPCRNSPACQVAGTYVTEEVRFNDWDASAAVPSLVQCGTTAGHMSP